MDTEGQLYTKLKEAHIPLMVSQHQMKNVMCNHKKLKSDIKTSTVDAKIGNRWVSLKGDITLRDQQFYLSQHAGHKISPPKTTEGWGGRE